MVVVRLTAADGPCSRANSTCRRRVQARVGVKMSPPRSPTSVSTASSTGGGRRRTLPGFDEAGGGGGGPWSLDGRRRNLSEPHLLHAVSGAGARGAPRRSVHSPVTSPRSAVRQLHACLQRKLTAPSDVSRPLPASGTDSCSMHLASRFTRATLCYSAPY